MRRRFNVTGSCNPERHYMVETSKRFEAVEELIDNGEYFTINRARQYGKTTMLRMICRKLSDKYLIIDMSFEGVGDGAFQSEASFVQLFVTLMKESLQYTNETCASFLEGHIPTTMQELSKLTTDFCQSTQKPVLLICYLATRGMEEGYLVTFDFPKDKKSAELQWMEWSGKQIFEVIV